MALDPEVKRQIEAASNASIKSLEKAIMEVRHPVSRQVRTQLIEQVRQKTADLLLLAGQHNITPDEVGAFKTAISVDPAGPALDPNGIGQQALDELLASRVRTEKQKEQLDSFRAKYETEYFGKQGATLQEALSSPQGQLGQLSDILRKQQSDVFQQELKPLIDQGLASQGLFDSGAKVEQQAKALGGLERARQDTLLQAALGGKESLRGLERTDILSNQANQQAAMQNVFDLQRTGLSMLYQERLEDRRAQLARELSQYRGGSNLLASLAPALGAVGGAALGSVVPGVGTAAGAVIGGGLGGAIGGQFGGGAQFGASLGATLPQQSQAAPMLSTRTRSGSFLNQNQDQFYTGQYRSGSSYPSYTLR